MAKIASTVQPKIEGPRPSKAGGEIWRVVTDGNIKTIVTSSSSTATMDETVNRFNKALKRLAKR